MNIKSPNHNPATTAVTQTLAGERMTITVNFPTTGDGDCDFIQGIQAVAKAIDINAYAAVRVLRYLLERFGRELDNEKQFPQMDWQLVIEQTVRKQVYELYHEQQRQAAMVQPNQPWYGSIGGTSAGSCPPGVISSQATASQIDSIQQMVEELNIKP